MRERDGRHHGVPAAGAQEFRVQPVGTDQHAAGLPVVAQGQEQIVVLILHRVRLSGREVQVERVSAQQHPLPRPGALSGLEVLEHGLRAASAGAVSVVDPKGKALVEHLIELPFLPPGGEPDVFLVVYEDIVRRPAGVGKPALLRKQRHALVRKRHLYPSITCSAAISGSRMRRMIS